MGQENGKTSRREFLGFSAAGLASATFALSTAKESLGSALIPASETPRNSYKTFSEGRIAGLHLKNRLVRSATAEGASPGGRMNEEGLGIYGQLAKGGVGLIITGHMVAVRGGDAHENQTHIDDGQYIDAARRIVDTVHRHGAGCKVVAQLSHAGPNGIVDPVTPFEAGSQRTGRKPRVLSSGEIEELIAQFAASVGRAKGAGFDGVEIHGAHGYLLSAFLSPSTNKRDDDYGGSASRRAAIIRKIVAAARREVGPDYPILIKVNCNDQGEDESAIASFLEMAGEIEKAGVSAIDVSGRNAARTEIDSPEKESYFLQPAERAHLKVPVVLTGGNRSIERMEAIIQKGNVQFLALARPLIREPDLPSRWLEGRGSAAAACISCNDCLRGLAKTPTRCVRLNG